MLRYHAFTVNLFMENSYLLWDESKDACIIDPGFSTREEQDELLKFVSEHQLNLTRCLCTHRHLDHIMGTAFIHHQWEILPEYSATELREMPFLSHQCKEFGLPMSQDMGEAGGIPFQTEDDGLIHFGLTTLHILETPGHTPGHVTFYCDESVGTAFVGDVLFAGGLGRTDLWGGNYDALIVSITQTLFSKLPASTIVCSGHGPTTTLGQEKKYF